MRFARVVLVALATGMPPPAFASTEERQIVYYSVWGDCIGNPRTPLCALETLFSCMVRDDRAMCASVGAASQLDCAPNRITGVRYVVGQVMEMGSAARITFHASVCRADRSCPAPAAAQSEELERSGAIWRFRSEPRMYALACRS